MACPAYLLHWTKPRRQSYGLVFTAWGLGGFMLALLAGRVYDQTRAITFAYYLSAGLLAAAALITFLVRPPRRAESRAEAAAVSPMAPDPVG